MSFGADTTPLVELIKLGGYALMFGFTLIVLLELFTYGIIKAFMLVKI